MKRFIDWLFDFEPIDGNGAVEKYLHRWCLLRFFGYAVYLHHFIGDDWSRDMHDHPKRFWSIGFRGSYIEQTPNDIKRFDAPWFRSFPAEHIHRLALPEDCHSCWTIVVVGKHEREWGFVTKRGWIDWRTYVFTKTGKPE